MEPSRNLHVRQGDSQPPCHAQSILPFPQQETSPQVPEECLGAVGGAEPIVDYAPTYDESSQSPHSERRSRIPLLNFALPESPSIREPIRRHFDNDMPLSPPVPVAEVESQASEIIHGFFDQKWRQETGQGVSEFALPPGSEAPISGIPATDTTSVPSPSPGSAPPHPSLTLAAPHSTTTPNTLDPRSCQRTSSPSHDDKIRRVSAKMCMIAEEIDQRYSLEFDDMIDFMKINGASAYESFASVAKLLLSDRISWSKVIALMAFGYRIARRLFDASVPKFVQKIMSYLSTFICKHIAKWIAERGGWGAILNLEEGISWAGIFGVMSIGFGALAIASWVKNKL